MLEKTFSAEAFEQADDPDELARRLADEVARVLRVAADAAFLEVVAELAALDHKLAPVQGDEHGVRFEDRDDAGGPRLRLGYELTVTASWGA